MAANSFSHSGRGLSSAHDKQRLLKVSKSGSTMILNLPEKPLANNSTNLVSSCHCCGQVLSFPEATTKFKCSVCKTTNMLSRTPTSHDSQTYIDGTSKVTSKSSLSYSEICKYVDNCMFSAELIDPSDPHKRLQTLHTIFEPLSSRLYSCFKSIKLMNTSFLIRPHSTSLHHSFCNIDFQGVRHSFSLLTRLPTKRPLYNALHGAVDLLKRTRNQQYLQNGEDPRNLYFLLILLEIPFLSVPLNPPKVGPKATMVDDPVIRSLTFEILLRSIGILCNSLTKRTTDYLTSWISQSNYYKEKVEIINLYITQILRKYYDTLRQKSNSVLGTAANLLADSKDALASPITTQTEKIKLNQYGNDWQLKSASKVLLLLFKANTKRGKQQIPCNAFYNSLVDFVQVKLDFDSWQNTKKASKSNSNIVKSPGSSNVNSPPDLETVIEYIQNSQRSAVTKASFYFCQYPFLISLGAKITILEFEARRKMERKAEEAFIKSIDQKVVIDVFFKVRVRRDHIVQDSIRCIHLNSENLNKSLKVQFIDEVGIDAGGLKKEWFLLLTKALFNPNSGMFIESDESNLLWFAVGSIESLDMFYLFGSILGLAIYNSTILDLNFPQSLYKLLLGRPVTFDDYEAIYPETARNLLKLKQLSESELLLLEITFECTFSDRFDNIHTMELVENGKQKLVEKSNLGEYIHRYSQFFIFDRIKSQLNYFQNGFNAVVGGNALSLFHPEELELLICGTDEKTLDLEVLKSITKYIGFCDRVEAESSKIINWFWEYMRLLDFTNHKKILLFITGSDRVPATGLQSLNFRIRVINKDSKRLPIAHTCFNELELYKYATKEKLISKLSTAVNESSGFGIK